MSDFLGGAEIAARAEMLTMSNKLGQAELQAQKANSPETKESVAKLKKVSQQFESIFLSYMMKQMRKTVPDDPIFGNSVAKDVYYDMHDDAVANELSKAGGIGLAVILYNQLSKMNSPSE